MSAFESTGNERRVYDDIPFEKRKKLIQLIDSGKWTIRGAAKQTDIKLCTAKYILYHYRKKGIIYDKKRGNFAAGQSDQVEIHQREPLNQIVFMPVPVYVFCPWPSSDMPTNLLPLYQP